MSDSCFTPRKTLKLHCTDIKRILNCLRRNAIACGLLRHFAACGYSPCSMWNWEFFFWHKAACDFFFCVQLLGPSIFLALLLLRVSPPPTPPAKTFRGAARCAFGSNKCTWRKSVIQYRSRPHVYLLGGSKWLLANALIFVALAECTLHGAVLRGDLTSCVGRGGQEASREHMQADPRREAQPGCS